jgi:hypothetical protein
MVDFGADIDDIAEDVENKFSVDFRDPYEKPYGDPERQTDSQRILWEYLREHNIWRQALIGAKGAGKTYYGATFAFFFGQKWPGAEGVVVGNTDRQAKDAAGGPFLEVCRALGYEAEYFSSKKIRGQEQSKFYVVDLDGEGYEQGNTFMLKVRSLEAVQAMEGSEFDFMWFEEIQQGDKQDFVTANSRNRGTHIAGEDTQNPLFIAGMTAGASHWMYSMLEENMSFVVDERFDPEEHDSVLREPVLTENKKNIGQAKIDEYYNTFSSTEAERLIHAKRVSQNSDRAMYEYREDKHRNGRMSRLMCQYDRYDSLILSVDFNISPMCGSLWQRKKWNPKWNQQNVRLEWSGDKVRKVIVVGEDGEEETYDSLTAFAPPNQTILAQVDEYEVWPKDRMGGGTEGLMRHVVRDYAEMHHAPIEIVGDAQGNSKTAASTETNWDIIRQYAAKFDEPIVVPGLKSSRKGSGEVTGEIKWSNPPVEDTLTAANRLLQNAEGQARMCFLPHSEYQSDGVAASVAAVERKGSGKIDDRRDRSDDRSKPRTHWFDTVRYVAWYFNNEIDEDQRDIEQMIDEMQEDRREVGQNLPDGMDPARYSGFPDKDEGEGGWMDFGSGGAGGVF